MNVWRSSCFLSLIDRGANGGICEDDLREVSLTERSINVQGIDNHHCELLVQLPERREGTSSLFSISMRTTVVGNQYIHPFSSRTMVFPSMIALYLSMVLNPSSQKMGTRFLSTSRTGSRISIYVNSPTMNLRHYPMSS